MNHVLESKIPPSFLVWCQSDSSHNKKDGGVWPIAVGGMLRHVVAKVASNSQR